MTSHDEAVTTERFAGDEALWRLTNALSSSLTPLDVAQSLANEGAAAAGGVFANMAIRLVGVPRVRVVHRSSRAPGSAQSRDVDLDDAIPACEAIRTGLPVLLGSTEDIDRRFPNVLSDVLAENLAARASLPIHDADGEALGAIGIGWAEPQTFDAALLRRLDLIAVLTGLALARAQRGRTYQDAGGDLAQALETMPNAFVALDSELCITQVNAEGARLLGSTSDQLTGRKLLDAFPDAAGSQFETQYRRAIDTGQPVVFEECFVPLGRWFEIHAWPASHGLNVFFADISSRHDVAEQQSTALTEAVTANLRLQLLTEVSSALTGCEARDEVFQRLTAVLIPSMADWCTVVVPGDDQLVRVAARHREPALDALAKRLIGTYPHAYSGPSPGVVAYRSGEPLRMGHLAQEIVDDLDDSAASAAYGRTLQLLGDGPGLLIPVLIADEVQGVITVIRRGDRAFSDADLATMTDVAAAVSVALVNADLLRTQRDTARALQAAALPVRLPAAGGLTLAAIYRAASGASNVGGDWYDAFELETGRIAIVVGDVAGHGLSAAALTVQMRNALRAHLFSGLGPLESLTQLSRLIATQEPGALATIICAEIDPVTGHVIWASAGHPAPIRIGPDGTSAYLSGQPIPPIGAPHDSEADEHRLTLCAGDRLLMFTDGLFERRNAAIDVGLAHLMIVAEQTIDRSNPSEACEAILTAMVSGAHDDDVCLLIADFASD